MREYSLARTSNVRKAEELFTYLQKRPKTEMVGLGLIYGPPGLGKSRFARQTAIQNDYIYFRLEATMTAKAFAIKLLERIHQHFGMQSLKVRGTGSEIFSRVTDILENYNDIVIVIDEIDYAFRSQKILGSIRDIVDETLTTIVLVGMTDAKSKLLALDSHYFDRCNFFCEFKPMTKDDIKLLCDEICDVKLTDPLVQHLSKKTKGNIRKLVKSLYSIEDIAKERNLTTISPEHMTMRN